MNKPRPAVQPIKIDQTYPQPKDMILAPPTPKYSEIFEIVQRILDQADEILSDARWTELDNPKVIL